jgi:hypothetical protein
MVTDGLHFGQAPMEVFMRDAVSSAIQFMQLMTAGKTKPH